MGAPYFDLNCLGSLYCIYNLLVPTQIDFLVECMLHLQLVSSDEQGPGPWLGAHVHLIHTLSNVGSRCGDHRVDARTLVRACGSSTIRLYIMGFPTTLLSTTPPWVPPKSMTSHLCNTYLTFRRRALASRSCAPGFQRTPALCPDSVPSAL